jgi:hypothetical protein
MRHTATGPNGARPQSGGDPESPGKPDLQTEYMFRFEVKRYFERANIVTN